MCRYLDLWPCGPEDRLHLERLLGWKPPAMPARPATPPPAAGPPKGRPEPQVCSLPADCAALLPSWVLFLQYQSPLQGQAGSLILPGFGCSVFWDACLS